MKQIFGFFSVLTLLALAAFASERVSRDINGYGKTDQAALDDAKSECAKYHCETCNPVLVQQPGYDDEREQDRVFRYHDYAIGCDSDEEAHRAEATTPAAPRSSPQDNCGERRQPPCE
jgi:hypothetical protein